MVDFDKLKTKKTKSRDIEPTEIFRRLPKPSGINDLYTSQAEVLQAWFKRRQERDVVLKLHTGGGKTLVGLLMAQSTLNDDFVNGNAIMVGTYKALFNGRSKFGLRGGVQPQQISAVILDDTHAAF